MSSNTNTNQNQNNQNASAATQMQTATGAEAAVGTNAVTTSNHVVINSIIDNIQSQMNMFVKNENIDVNLSKKERRRLISAGIKNYGFIDKAYDIARDNQQYFPPVFSIQQMGRDLEELETIRHLAILLEQFQQTVNENLLIKGDKNYRNALQVYNILRDQGHSKVTGADALYESLKYFFRKQKASGEGNPTEKELKRDFNRLLHGKAEGKMEIVNENPRQSGGVHTVVGEVNKKHAMA
jgi:adenine-specific DNA methylase